MALGKSRVVRRSKTNPDTVEKKYLEHAAFLNSLMTISTLLAGFIITGVLLAVNLSGEENFNNHEVRSYLFWSLTSAGSSIASTLLTFVILARGSNIITQGTPVQALQAMELSFVWIAIAEILLYVCLLSFVRAIGSFVKFTYLGPDICVYQLGALEYEDARPASFCGSLGLAMWEVALATCPKEVQHAVERRSPAVNRTHAAGVLCDHVLDYYEWCLEFEGDSNCSYELYHYMWDEPNIADRMTQAKIQSLAEGLCMFSSIQANSHAACNVTTTVSEKANCAQATQAVNDADACVGGKVDDVSKCHKVCPWTEDDQQGKSIVQSNVGKFTLLSSCAILTILALRVFRIVVAWRHAIRKIQSDLEHIPCWRVLLVAGCCLDELEAEVDGDDEPAEVYGDMVSGV